MLVSSFGGHFWHLVWRPSISCCYLGFFFILLFIGTWLLYNILLVSAVPWSESAIHIHLSPPSWPFSHPPPSYPLGHHRAPSWTPYAIHQFPTSCFTHDGVCMFVLLSQVIPPSSSLIPRLHISSLCLHFYFCLGNRFICTIFPDLIKWPICLFCGIISEHRNPE